MLGIVVSVWFVCKSLFRLLLFVGDALARRKENRQATQDQNNSFNRAGGGGGWDSVAGSH